MIHLDHISKRYVGRGGTVDALKDVSVHVEKGDIYGIIGFSGAGKSTLIRMVNRLETPDSGTVTVDGHRLAGLSKAELRQVRRKIGMVFQQFNLLDSKTVFQKVAIPLILEVASKYKITARVKKVLRFVELEDKRDTYVSQLSGGQKQRVGIARALATEPAILLCDEATSALAPQTTESILQLLKRVNREMGVTILPITHQMQVIQKIITAILSLTLALSLSACGGSGSSTSAADNSNGSGSAAPAEKTEIKYSKSQGPYTELFEAAIVPILEKQGYTLTCVETPELLVADQLLNSGEVDVNVEQHTAYAESFNANNDGDLVPISPIPTVPAGVYSVNHSSLDEISDGAKVAVPNDASNTARCYLMLQKIGWITLDPDVDPSSVTQDDIIENPYNIEFTEMKSLTIPAAIQDFDYVAITGSVVYNAGIDASTALANEDIMDHLVLQVVVKEENKDTDWAKAIVDAYHSDEFKQYMAENNDGLWWIPEELR